jgi:hypothetical protein
LTGLRVAEPWQTIFELSSSATARPTPTSLKSS